MTRLLVALVNAACFIPNLLIERFDNALGGDDD